MCPAHRTAQLTKIRAALDGHLPVRVIATTVIEAGVDIDFPRVFRLKAGLDSIAQAAGRCNREGRRPRDQSIITVFEVEGWSVVPELRPTLAATDEALRRVVAKQLDPLGLEAVEAYFNELFWKKGLDDKLDAKKIITACDVYWSELPFATVAQAYRLIESDMEPIIIPYDDRATAAIARLANPALASSDVRGAARSLQPYLVNVPPRAINALGSRLEPINPHRFERQFLCLTAEAMQALYSDTGLDLSDPTFQRIEATIF
jgi:CRISPR-associated endonuclease/helicase Cas3